MIIHPAAERGARRLAYEKEENRIAKRGLFNIKRKFINALMNIHAFPFGTAECRDSGASRSFSHGGEPAKGKETHLRGELKAFVAFRRSSSQHPSSFSRGRRILPLTSQWPPCSPAFSLSFGASSRRARPRIPSSAAFRLRPGPPRIHIP